MLRGRECWRGYARHLSEPARPQRGLFRVRSAREARRVVAAIDRREPARNCVRLVAGSAAQPFLEPENAPHVSARSARSRGLGRRRASSYLAGAEAREKLSRSATWVALGGRGVLFIIPLRSRRQIRRPALRSNRHVGATGDFLRRWTGAEREPAALWFVVDELDFHSARSDWAEGRAAAPGCGSSARALACLGFQSIGPSVFDLRERGRPQTIVENCGNTH